MVTLWYAAWMMLTIYKTLGNPHQIVYTVNNHGGKFYNHGGLYPRVFRRWCIRGKFVGKPRRLKPLGFHETPEVNTSVVSFTTTGVNVKLVHTAPGIKPLWRIELGTYSKLIFFSREYRPLGNPQNENTRNQLGGTSSRWPPFYTLGSLCHTQFKCQMLNVIV